MWSVFDNFRYMYENFPDDPANSPNGDGTVSARVVSLSGATDAWTKTGVMIRGQGGSDPEAPYYGVFVTPANGIVVQWRSAEGALTNQLFGSPGGGSSTLPPVTPTWVMAERYTEMGTNTVYYAGFASTDDVHWTWIPGSTVALNITGFLTSGIAADSHNDAAYTTATVDNLGQLGGSSAPPDVCPNGWSCNDIGGALAPGQDTLSSAGTWNEVGGGGDIWGTADSFHFVSASQPLAGDGMVTALVSSQQATDPWAKAGVMLRATTDPGSPYYGAFATPGNGVAVQWRVSQGGSSTQILAAGAVPLHLMVVRYTTTGSDPQTFFSAYTSPDGVNWTLVPGSTQALNLPQPLLGGLAVTSHVQGAGGAVTFNAVSVTTGEYPGPSLTCPSGWSCADIGSVSPAGGQNQSGTSWNVLGGGPDIWGTADAFHFVWQNLPGDGSANAKVGTPTATDPWAKSGLMIRGGTIPGAPYYAAYLTAGNGIHIQARTANGASAVEVASLAGSGPIYLEVARSGASFTAYTSTNGSTWTPVPGSTVTIPGLTGAALAGMAVCSHNAGALSTTTFNAATVS